MVRDYANFSSSQNREVDKNGFLHVRNCVLTKSEVNQYYGAEIPGGDQLGLDPDKIYNVLRPAEEIQKSLEGMNGLPILDEHDDTHDATHPTAHKRIGCIGTDVTFQEPEVTGTLTFWNANQVKEIQSGQRDNVSMGYDYTAELTPGTYRGKKYDVVMRDISWNHVALVDKGRVPGAKVADRLPSTLRRRTGDYSPQQAQLDREYFTLSTKTTPLTPAEQKRLIELNRKREVQPMKTKTGKDADPYAYSKKQNQLNNAVKRSAQIEANNRPPSGSKKQLAEEIKFQEKTIAMLEQKMERSSNSAEVARLQENIEKRQGIIEQKQNQWRKAKDKLPVAGSKPKGDSMAPIKKKRGRDAEVPAAGQGGEEQEEVKENRVIAGLKALAAEFDNIHEEQGINPGMTDDEQGALQKVQDFLDSFHNQGSQDEPGEEAGTSMDPMDAEPEYTDLEAGDADPEEEEEAMDEDWPDNGSAPKGKGDRAPRRRKGMDAAMIEQRITARFRAKDHALNECEGLVGSMGKMRVLDSARDVYAYALKTNGITFPETSNLSGLRGMVQMLKRSRTSDAAPFTPQKATGVDAQVQEMLSKSPYAPRV